jgi:hypothetical protein
MYVLIRLSDLRKHASTMGFSSNGHTTLCEWAKRNLEGLMGLYSLKHYFDKNETQYVGILESRLPDTIRERRPMGWVPPQLVLPDFESANGLVDIPMTEFVDRINALNPGIGGISEHDVRTLAKDGRIITEKMGKKSKYFWPSDVETKKCTNCLHHRPISEFQGVSSMTIVARCSSCRDKDAAKTKKRLPARNHAQRIRNAKKMCVIAEEHARRVDDNIEVTDKMCTHCKQRQPLSEFVSNANLVLCTDRTETQTCSKCRATGAKLDAKPERKEYHSTLQAERRYDRVYVERQLEKDPIAFRQHKHDVHKLWLDLNPERVDEMNEHKRLTPDWRIESALREKIRQGLFVEPSIGQKIVDIAFDPCVYCGAPAPENNAQSIDRLDSSKGYISSNIVPSCTTCNIAKGSMDPISFILSRHSIIDDAHATRITHFQREFPLAKRIPSIESIPINDDRTACLFEPMDPPCDTIITKIFDEEQKTILRSRRPSLPPLAREYIDELDGEE